MTAIILYLYVGQFLSKKRAAEGLDGFLTEVADRVAGSEVAGFDETGLRMAGTLHWVHCARTGKYTLITCHPKRGSKGIDAAGVLDRFRAGSRCATPWHRMTPTSMSSINCAVPTPSVN